MCKILTFSFVELLKYNLKLIFSPDAASEYATSIVWNKLFNSLGDNITKYVEDWSLMVLEVSIQEDETEVSYTDQIVELFFLKQYDQSIETINKRNFIENLLMELLRFKLQSEYAYPTCELIAKPNLIHTIIFKN